MDHVFQLADISRPPVARHRLHRLRLDPGHPLAGVARIFLEKVLHQQGNVLAPVAQGRHSDGKDDQSIEKVLA
jgi:hypothetical protein